MRKKYYLHDENQHDQPEGDFTEHNMNRSHQSWVKTFIQDVMDEKRQVLFDNLSWFVKNLCLVMTSVSACDHMWNIEGWIHNKSRNRLTKPNVEKAVRVRDNLVLRQVMFLSRQHKVAWDSQTNISEPGTRRQTSLNHGTRRQKSVNRHTNEQGVDDSDDDCDSDVSTVSQELHSLSE